MNPYIPKFARIVKVKKETSDVKTFRFKLNDGSTLTSVPGQVIMVSVFGFGEATFGIIQTERENEYEFTVKRVGNVTQKLFRMKKGDVIGIRGPFGNGYPVRKMKGKNIVIVGGGIGIPPLKSLVLYLLERRNLYGDIEVYYGARTPEDVVYKNDLKEWKKRGIKVEVTVDKGNEKWRGNVGVVTTLLENMKVGKNTVACICGPPIMLKFVSMKLVENGMKEDQIYVSMERLMKCGIGLCGHCNIGKAYVCKDGPVFTLKELKKLTERVW